MPLIEGWVGRALNWILRALTVAKERAWIDRDNVPGETVPELRREEGPR
jgi:hypothetical protein